MVQQTQLPPLIVPPDVLHFAVQHGVAAYLPAVMEMTQRVFPQTRHLAWVLEDDWEIEDDRHLVVAVQVENLEVSQALQARYEWHRGLFACCPAPQVSAFRLKLETVA
jgi:hypothetical protein